MAEAVHTEMTWPLEADFALPVPAQHALALLLVAAAAVFAMAASSFVPAPGLALVFVLPVIIAGVWFGWWPSLTATAASVLAFDFFFTQPYYSLRIADPSEMWTAGLLLVIAAIVAAVVWRSRRREFEARRAAEQAAALQALAHAIIQGAEQPVVIQAAADALGRIFGAPVVVLSEAEGRLRSEATAGGAKLSEYDLQAARHALTERAPVRAETYPHDRAQFDMWPIANGAGRRYVIGVDFSRSDYARPERPDRFVDIAAAYLAERPQV